ncbi:hypothetical protein HZC53_00745 [Candidatus Uhrbacteria bacterium]|nr:hypothetical protein [Candidatus Uhrbacteria bacterium]
MQQIPQMTKAEATRVVTDAFEGKRRDDAVLNRALELCGMSRAVFVTLRSAAQGVERGMAGCCILTPTGGQRRR